MNPDSKVHLRCDLEGVTVVAQQVTNLTSICENVALIPALAQWVTYPTSP